MRQITFDDFSDTTENLECLKCEQHTVTLTSKWSDEKRCYYWHKAICSNCGFAQYPTGVKDFLVANWEDGHRGMRNYYKMKGWEI